MAGGTTPRSFDDGSVEGVARAVGDLYSGTELTRVLQSANLTDPLGEGATKWKRLYDAVAEHQDQTQSGRAMIALVHAAMSPTRTLSRIEQAATARDAVNQVLSLSGLEVRPDGRVVRVSAATTDAEARARTEQLIGRLRSRGAHSVVLSGIRPELLKTDYYEAVFESVKTLGHRLRSMTGLDLDGYELVESALLGSAPHIRLNELATVTDKNEQRGVARLAQGVFSAFRNPQAHEPRHAWHITEQDALDVLATLSLIHRRLDSAIGTH